MERAYKAVIELLKKEVCGASISFDEQFKDKDLAMIFQAAKQHDLAHAVGFALLNDGRLKNKAMENAFTEQIYSAVYRHEISLAVLKKVCAVLEKAKIPYIPLKGAAIKNYYPKPWLRSSCDIDILVVKKDAEKAVEFIAKNLGYKKTLETDRVISLLSTENICIEIHCTLSESGIMPAAAKILDDVWLGAERVKENGYEYKLNDSMFYFYHIAHMAKHFVSGGCGIRPFLDLWLMNRKEKFYAQKSVRKLLSEGKLEKFEKNATRLSNVWFSNENHDELSSLCEKYIFEAGIFGCAETLMLSRQRRAGGRAKYVLSRLFLPYRELKKIYPIIIKHKFLTPVCEICRIISFLFGKKKNFGKRYLKNLTDVSKERLNDIDLLFEGVGF